MAEQSTSDAALLETASPVDGGKTFAREELPPASHDTGGDIDEMNETAAESVITNVTPDEVTG